MKNLKIWQRLALIAAVFILPFAVAAYRMVSSVNTLGVEFARQELRGLEYYRPLLNLLQDLQQHRDMASAWLNGDASFEERVGSKSTDIENDIRKVNDADRRLNDVLGVGKKWAAVAEASRTLLAGNRSVTAVQSFDQHSRVIEDTIGLIGDVGDGSNLTLDPDIDSYYLMNVLVFQGPELSESLAQARALGGALSVTKGNRAEQFEPLNRLSILAGFLQRKVDGSLGKAVTFNGALTPVVETYTRTGAAQVRDAAGYVAKLGAGRKVDANASDYYATLSQSVNAVFEMSDRVTGALTGLLNARVDRFHREELATLAWAALALLAVCAVSFLMMRDITVTLGKVVHMANRIAAGDLTVEATSSARKDEIGVLARAFERMVDTLKETVGVAERIAAGDLSSPVTPRSERDVMGHALANMVARLSLLMGQVQQSGIQVNTSVNEIAAGAREQQATAGEIAATTIEIGATSKEISATSKELVRTMDEVSTVAEHTATLAASGQLGLTRMEATMRHVMDAAGSITAKLAVLNEKAGNITQVVTTITKVADQTNLLSLNAAIEAEKAGEYGRGFAVVATEIRRLADQTAVATDDIEQMVKDIQSAVSAGVMGMDKFSEEVRRGMQEMQQVGGQLSEIIQQVQALAPRCEAVNEGMRAQATGAEQITEALAQLSDAAQQTVESLRQSGQAIDGLNQAASGMRSGVSRFTLAA
jgi:methyl-accepting chemotaxis protein